MVKLPDMATLHERHYGISPRLGPALGEAAAVCLSRHHTSPTPIMATHPTAAAQLEAEWALVGQRERVTWANETEATEFGACAVAIAVVEQMMGLEVVSRAPSRSGADYHVASRHPADSSGELDLEAARRLEVSGTDLKSHALLLGRLSAKVNQLRRGGAGPGVAVVVGFYLREVSMRDL